MGTWAPVERTVSWLTVDDHPMRVWVTGSFAGLHVNVSQEAGAPSSTIDLNLFRERDQSAVAATIDRGRFSASEQQLPPTPALQQVSLQVHGFPEMVRRVSIS